ncbi:hypothetical protein CkaCkLH20_05685 [Colletotrichum karsti]|uniref:Short chain dehydrogenase asqE n=1 Tax=Colletotrichum karsti TaxID=1095194 RepID=A0A9P6LI05_9PEZI|nr:uncharacterized protein CkaCkLH20_05685 [Colletotrichum karsti]KAF9876839.1 hypothetical protein CkaCkLH20_05685 [Colletotrichum karsti]
MSEALNTAQPWSLAGKTAIVTAGSRGIGRGIAVHLARKGVENIAITYAANKDAADETIQQCRALGVNKAIAIKADATDPEAWPNVVKEVVASLGVTTLDILVNNAIVGSIDAYKPMPELRADNFSTVMVANTYVPVATTLAFMEYAPKYGGRVINISSIASKVANADPLITYGASKAALDSFMRSFADSFSSDRGITFNSVMVGPTATDSLNTVIALSPEGLEQQMKSLTSAAPRLGLSEDIGYIVGFLASEEGRWVNGAAVSANGGYKPVLAALG